MESLVFYEKWLSVAIFMFIISFKKYRKISENEQ
jgi:hypothetical protein